MLSRAQIADVINAGGVVRWKDGVIRTLADIPTQEQLDDSVVVSPGGSVSFGDITGDPADNTALAAALNALETSGSTLLYGTAAPTTEGTNGDFYIRTSTNFIYGPKAAGTWPSGVSLVGPAGATGSTGAAGATGPTGPAGPTGSTGATGPAGSTGAAGASGATGSTGPQGAAGADGKTILYGTAAPTTEGNNGDFYIRTSTNFIYGPKAGGAWPAGTSLIGPTGATGATGAAGSNGSNGADAAAPITVQGVAATDHTAAALSNTNLTIAAASLAASSKYQFEAFLAMSSDTTAGVLVGIAGTGTLDAVAVGSGASLGAPIMAALLNFASGQGPFITYNGTGIIRITGMFITAATPAAFTIQLARGSTGGGAHLSAGQFYLVARKVS